MAGRAQFTNVDPATAAEARRQGSDPHELDRVTETMLHLIYTNLPHFPVTGCRLRRALADSAGVDRLSNLPPELLRDIVSRLPVKDAARTAVLSSPWRRIWISTPLLLSDAHLLPEGSRWPLTPADSPAITAAVSRILEAHPGPFNCVRLVCTNMSSYRPQFLRWLKLLADKGIEDLALINRPWPRDLCLPDIVLSITTLTRLYLGQWKLPATGGASFPHLRELGLCCVQMEQDDVDSLVAKCPVLEILNILGCIDGLRLHLVSQSLRCVQISISLLVDIVVVKAPLLEWLIMYRSCPHDSGSCTRVRIRHAPKLHTVGYLEPGQVLKIRNNIITPGMEVSASAMLTSVKILSLEVRFGVFHDIKMVPTFLRCFPNAERLHIMSKIRGEPTEGNIVVNFWEECGSIVNVASQINVMSLREFTGEPGEVAFLNYFFLSARVVRNVVVGMANPILTPFSTDEALSKVRRCCKNMPSDPCTTHVLQNNGPAGGALWRFDEGADFSCRDPFSVLEVVKPMA